MNPSPLMLLPEQCKAMLPTPPTALLHSVLYGIRYALDCSDDGLLSHEPVHIGARLPVTSGQGSIEWARASVPGVICTSRSYARLRRSRPTPTWTGLTAVWPVLKSFGANAVGDRRSG
eukprot:5960107-Prymnesium_polylepis.3